ncbi:MAG: hypothetical protein A2Z86_00715 [Candidatus Glassbacteria bacterium GWA2_58_10]|uniref:SHS2 domain-containing protein n=1 Tax=Candidatus Glassbacteria bacterium GWA2_58_10 TaxID=1817865 RepID=A0A1F5Y9S1_9BACT|nr:MAG: hypothetical protein A2Z86_00715 [Candidatus Glassbacteria bacterium GWA2_58_10]
MAQQAAKQKKSGGKSFSPASILDKLGVFHRSGKNVLGVQLAGDMLRVIEIDKSVVPHRVINFSAIDPLMENTTEAADQILGLMHEKNMTARVAHATVYEHGTELRQVSLPILAKKEMDAVVRRELKKILPESSAKDVNFDYWFEKSAKKGRKADVLIGVIPKESSNRIITLMEQCQLDTELLTTVPLALIAAMGLMGEKYMSKISTMIHLERDRSYLVIANRGTWVFSREFQSVLNKEQQEEQKDVSLSAKRRFASARYMADKDRLLIEVNRSLLYFKQRFRGEGVSQAILSGEAFNLEEVVASFQASLGIEAALFSPVSAFRTDALGDRADKLGRIFPSLALPVGAAQQSLRVAKLNFVPLDYINRHKARARRVMMIAASVVLMIVMTVGYVLVRNSRVELEQLIAQNEDQKELTTLTKKLDAIAEVIAQRDLLKTRQAFLDSFDNERGRLGKLLIALSYYVPENVVLYNVVLNNQGQFSATIYGQVQGAGIADSDKTFDEFFNRLKSSGLFSSVAEPEITNKVDQGQNVLAFKIQCQLNT